MLDNTNELWLVVPDFERSVLKDLLVRHVSEYKIDDYCGRTAFLAGVKLCGNLL
jgi:hypothetical protein